MRPNMLIIPCALISTTAIAAPVDFLEEYATHPLGVVDHTNYDAVRDLGARWMRMPVAWKYVETEDGVYNWSSGISTWLDEAHAAGLNGSIVISCNQFWATGQSGSSSDWPSYPPVDLSLDYDPDHAYSETYYDFISSLVTEYRDLIDRITIENEANTNIFWAGTSDDYRRLVATAAKAVEDHAPEILVFDSGVGSGSLGVAVAEWMIESATVDPQEILDFVNDFYAHDVYAPLEFDSFEELSYWIRQPFVRENNKKVDSMLGAVTPYVDGLNFKFTSSSWLLPTLVEWIDRRLARYGYTVPLKVNNEASNWPMGSSSAEAQNLFKMVILSLANGVDQTIWFPYSNALTNTPRKGLLDQNGDPTLQADAFTTLGQYIGTTFTFDREDVLGDGVHRYRFVAEGDVRPALDVMWWDDGGHGNGSESVTYTLPTFTDHVLRVGYLGATTELPGGPELTTTVDHRGQMFLYTFSPLDVDPSPGSAPAVTQNAPNPFHEATTIVFSIPESLGGDALTLRVYDAGGRAVRTLASGSWPSGAHAVSWDGRDDDGRPQAAGTYWYRLTTREGSSSRRMLLLR